MTQQIFEEVQQNNNQDICAGIVDVKKRYEEASYAFEQYKRNISANPSDKYCPKAMCNLAELKLKSLSAKRKVDDAQLEYNKVYQDFNDGVHRKLLHDPEIRRLEKLKNDAEADLERIREALSGKYEDAGYYD